MHSMFAPPFDPNYGTERELTLVLRRSTRRYRASALWLGGEFCVDHWLPCREVGIDLIRYSLSDRQSERVLLIATAGHSIA
jgi:hypothetical protein